MSNFLNGLVGRTRGTIPVAQPIIAPLFAPGPTMVRSEPELAGWDVMEEGQAPSVPQRRQIVSPPASPLTRTSTPQPTAPFLKNNQPLTRTDPLRQAPSTRALLDVPPQMQINADPGISETAPLQTNPHQTSPQTISQAGVPPSASQSQLPLLPALSNRESLETSPTLLPSVLINRESPETSPTLSGETIAQPPSETAISYSHEQTGIDNLMGENTSSNYIDETGKESGEAVIKEARQDDRSELRRAQPSEAYRPDVVVPREVVIDAERINEPLVDRSMMRQPLGVAETGPGSVHASSVQETGAGTGTAVDKSVSASPVMHEQANQSRQSGGLPIEQDEEGYVPLLKPQGNAEVAGVSGRGDSGMDVDAMQQDGENVLLLKPQRNVEVVEVARRGGGRVDVEGGSLWPPVGEGKGQDGGFRLSQERAATRASTPTRNPGGSSPVDTSEPQLIVSTPSQLVSKFVSTDDGHVGAQFIAPTPSHPISENTNDVGAQFIAPTSSHPAFPGTKPVPNNTHTVLTSPQYIQTASHEQGNNPTVQQEKAAIHIEVQQQILEPSDRQELLVPIQQRVVVPGQQEGMPLQQRDDMVIDDPLGDGRSAVAGGWQHGTAAQQGRERPSSQQRKETQGMETSAAAPTIHVTIGRIEVRAMPAPASAPRGQASRSGPALSLQDYLQQNKRRGS